MKVAIEYNGIGVFSNLASSQTGGTLGYGCRCNQCAANRRRQSSQSLRSSMIKNKLSEELKFFRADRPDEWKMDEFIRMAEKLESCIQTLPARPEDDNED